MFPCWVQNSAKTIEALQKQWKTKPLCLQNAILYPILLQIKHTPVFSKVISNSTRVSCFAGGTLQTYQDISELTANNKRMTIAVNMSVAYETGCRAEL